MALYSVQPRDRIFVKGYRLFCPKIWVVKYYDSFKNTEKKSETNEE